MTFYWKNHLHIDLMTIIIITALLWFAPDVGLQARVIVDPQEVSENLSKWLAGTLTLLGLIVATTGFMSNILEKDEFKPLAKSASVAQLWQIFRQCLGWLLIAALYCYLGSLMLGRAKNPELILIVGSFVGLMAIVSISKLVWVMRSVLLVKIINARRPG